VRPSAGCPPLVVWSTTPSADFCTVTGRPRGLPPPCSRRPAQTSRSKSLDLQRATAESTLGALDGCGRCGLVRLWRTQPFPRGLRCIGPTRPAPTPPIRFLFIGSRLCYPASFRRSLAVPPLRFTRPSRHHGGQGTCTPRSLDMSGTPCASAARVGAVVGRPSCTSGRSWLPRSPLTRRRPAPAGPVRSARLLVFVFGGARI
jgi:hypothetical protein